MEKFCYITYPIAEKESGLVNHPERTVKRVNHKPVLIENVYAEI